MMALTLNVNGPDGDGCVFLEYKGEGGCGGLNLGGVGDKRAALALRLRGDPAALRRHFGGARDEVRDDRCR